MRMRLAASGVANIQCFPASVATIFSIEDLVAKGLPQDTQQ